MKLTIKTKNIVLDDKLKTLIEKKFFSLGNFLNDFEKKEVEKGRPPIDLWLMLGKETFHHQKGKIFEVECKVNFFDKNFVICKKNEDLRSAIDEIKEILIRELEKLKSKTRTIRKHGAIEAKKNKFII